MYHDALQYRWRLCCISSRLTLPAYTRARRVARGNSGWGWCSPTVRSVGRRGMRRRRLPDAVRHRRRPKQERRGHWRQSAAAVC
jgi:hypothetical protein